eukprot:SAG31_NODE_10107_length_1182_cov_1.136657_1_plen_203_part_00
MQDQNCDICRGCCTLRGVQNIFVCCRYAAHRIVDDLRAASHEHTHSGTILFVHLGVAQRMLGKIERNSTFPARARRVQCWQGFASHLGSNQLREQILTDRFLHLHIAFDAVSFRRCQTCRARIGVSNSWILTFSESSSKFRFDEIATPCLSALPVPLSASSLLADGSFFIPCFRFLPDLDFLAPRRPAISMVAHSPCRCRCV